MVNNAFTDHELLAFNIFINNYWAFFLCAKHIIKIGRRKMYLIFSENADA